MGRWFGRARGGDHNAAMRTTSSRRQPGRLTRLLLGLLGLWAHAGAGAATGLAALPAAEGAPPLTLLYPTAAAAAPVQRGPYTVQAAVDAPPARGNGRLVVLSHGSGGAVWPQFDLAQALVAAGFTVAMPLHAQDNFEDARDAGPASWARRPQEISRSIDAVAALAAPGARFAPLALDLRRVGAYGMSAGGIAVLALAGARWSPAMLARHCDAHIAEDFPGCVGLTLSLTGRMLDPLKIEFARLMIRYRLGSDGDWRSWHEPRVAAVVAAVPMATPIDLASLAPPRVPLGLLRAGQDAWLAPRFHVDAVQAACGAQCTLLADLPQGGHGAFLSPLPPDVPGRAAPLLRDPPGFDRAVLPGVHASVADFFTRQLRADSDTSP